MFLILFFFWRTKST